MAFFGVSWSSWGNVEILGCTGFQVFAMGTTNGKRGGFFVGISELFDKTGFNHIVAVDKTNVIASGLFNTDVAGGGLASVFLANDFDARIFSGVLFDDVQGIVGGTVIDDDDFEILVSLVDDRI